MSLQSQGHIERMSSAKVHCSKRKIIGDTHTHTTHTHKHTCAWQKANCNEKFIYTFGFPEEHKKNKSKENSTINKPATF